MVVMSIDPGDTNTGFIIFSVTRKRIKILYTTVMDDLNPNPNEIVSIRPVLKALHKLRKKYKVTHLTIERYQNRGVRSQLVESISMLIGAIYVSFPRKKVKVYTVTALKWKNYVNGTKKEDRQRDIKRIEEWYRETFSTKHQQDSLLLGLFCIKEELGKDYLMKFRKYKKRRNKVWVMLEKKAITSDKAKPRGLKRAYGHYK